MPNWCNNTIEISHEDRSKMEALVEAVNEGKFFNHVIPVPRELQIVAGRVGDNHEYAQQLLEFTETLNVKFFGYKNWYDFCVNTWGTKWDTDPYNPVELPADSNKVTFGFDTAWAPATGVYDALMDQGFAVCVYYYEPGMAFCGIHDENGDETFDLSGMSSETVKDAIPEALDDMFGISEAIAEYEEEESQEENE